MKVRELIKLLRDSDPEAEVLFHEFMGCDGLVDMEFTKAVDLARGFAMDVELQNIRSDISIYESIGITDQGYKIATPVVALVSAPLRPVKTNATVLMLQGRNPNPDNIQ